MCFGGLPQYEIVDLGTLGGGYSQAFGINNAGQVVGIARTDARQVYGFLWAADTGMTDLAPADSNFSSRARAINNAGEVTGTLEPMLLPKTPSSGRTAFVWDSVNGMTTLNIHGAHRLSLGEEDVAYGINDSGQIAGRGCCFDTEISPAVVVGPGEIVVRPFPGINIPKPRAFLWDSTSGFLDIGVLGGSSSSAFGINNEAQVVGASATDDIVVGSTRRAAHAFVWNLNAGMEDLGTLGGQQSSARAINESGQIVGSSETGALDEDGRAINHAVMWNRYGEILDIHQNSLRENSTAFGINNNGQAVGCAFAVGRLDHLSGMFMLVSIIQGGSGISVPEPSAAFFWSPTVGMIDLNELLEPDSGWTHLISAEAINDKGQIVGYGRTAEGETHAFLMSPVDQSKYAALVIEDAVDQKLSVLETINTALAKEQGAYDLLDQMLQSGNYADLTRSDLVKARQRIHSAVQHQIQTVVDLERSIEELGDALESLGCVQN